ncbi:MAG TPA: glycosyltransferase family 25 protein [Pyrinomonadaceae bacterium]|nr:glycosyltransferase family 25 protein [Pyrinomonadaceae bacterium]
MLLNQLFPHKVCINLDRRPDRWQRMQAEFARHGIEDVRRISAVDGSTVQLPANWNHTAGAYGCLQSHIAVVQEARRLDHKSVLIFEDDAVFDPELEAKFSSFAEQVPVDWDMLYFGALHKDEPTMLQDHVYRITNANSTFAYALKHTVYDAFLELNARAEHVLDVNAYALQERFNCYCFMPNLAWVQIEYSDVQNRLERHWYLEKSLVLFGSHVDRLLSETAIVLKPHDRENLSFLEEYYKEYFAPLIQVVVDRSFRTGISKADERKRFFILSDGDLYLETLDLRANLLMCEQYDGATGFNEVIDLTPEQAQLLRQTGITRGIDVSKTKAAKDVQSQCRFIRRDALERETRLFQSPNHVLRLPRS